MHRGRNAAERGRDYAGSECTLVLTRNGRFGPHAVAATVAGRAHPFASVCSLTGPERAEFSWEAVARIMERDGRFYIGEDD